MTVNWGVHLLHATWQSAVVALIALAVARAFPRMSSRVRYALLLIATIKFALPPMLALPVGIFSALPPVGSGFFWPAERLFVTGPSSVLLALMWTQAAGGAAIAVLLAIRAWRVSRLIANATRIDRGTVASSETAVPFVYGFFRPTIVLPTRTWDGEQLHDVVAHESMHVALGDSRHAALQSLLAVVWWWNPVYWLLSSELRRVREERCDDAVLAEGLSTAWRYSRSLIDVAASSAALSPVAMASHALEPRLRRLADNRIRRTRGLRAREIAVLLLAALILLPGVGRSLHHMNLH